MHITTPTGSYWIVGEPSKKVRKALEYTFRPKWLQTALTITRYLSVPVLFLIAFVASGLVMKAITEGDNSELPFGMLLGATALFVVVAVALWNLYIHWVIKDDRYKALQEKARRGEISNVYPDSSLAYRAIQLDKQSDDFLSRHKEQIDRFLNRHGDFETPVAVTLTADAVLAIHREWIQMLDDATSMLVSMGININRLTTYRDNASQWLASMRESFEQIRNNAQSALERIDAEVLHQ